MALKKPKKLEKKDVENPVVAWARKQGCKVLKINPVWDAGWPDRLFCLRGGKMIFIEFKAPTGELSKRQQRVKFELERIRHIVYVIDTKEDGIALLRSLMEALPVHEKVGEVSPRAGGRRTVPRPRTGED